MQCPVCGHTVDAAAKFCSECGARLQGSAPSGDLNARDIHAQNVVVGMQVIQNADPNDPASLRRAYLNALFATVGKLALSGIDPKAASEAEARLNLGAVYTALLTLTPEECDVLTRENCLQERMGRSERRLSALAHLDQQARLVLLGDPGSGKSTFVNFTALCLAGEALGCEDANLERLREPLPKERDDDQDPEPQPWRHQALLPVRVVLRDFAARGLPPAGKPANADTLWAFIAAELGESLAEFAPQLKRHLREQGGLLLLDGLDEVPEAEQRREQLKQAVEDFAAKFPRCRILVTSRTYAYQQQAWRLAGFSEAVLAPFSRGQIERFVERWYAHIAEVRHLHATDAQGRAELLKRAIFSSDRLQGLAARPLLLTLMASLHAWRGGSLPEKREELYADTVDLLLDWWEQPKVVRAKAQVVIQQPSLAEWLRVGKKNVQEVLQDLAYAAHAAQPTAVGTADVPERALTEALLALNPHDPDVKYGRLVEFLRDRAGLLVPRGVGVYTFPHRTFQEYLAALYLAAHEYPTLVARLAREDANRWREVALLAGAATTARGSDFALWALVEELCPQEYQPGAKQAEADAWGALLAGQLIAENVNVQQVSARDQSKLKRVVGHLVGILEQGHLPAVERAAAGVALAHLGDPRPGVGLRADGLPDIVWCKVENFHISKYLVTNAQFATFVAAGGYRKKPYWTLAGWARKESESWNGPRSYQTPYDLPNHPVVGVSYYEAAAFCAWLSKELGYSVSLPIDKQWTQAAQGDDNREYPWGNKIDPDRANYGDTGIGTTSAVGCFPNGASPCGALDMSGNVFEWTGTEKDAVLRGGAFDPNEGHVRCSYRLDFGPDKRYPNIGFRVVCGVPHTSDL